MGNEWELTYRTGSHNNTWPWSDLVSLIHRYGNLKKNISSGKTRVYEYGCGTGNNYPFFRDLNMNYKAIEMSETAVKILLQKYPELTNKVIVGSFVKSVPPFESTDFVVDRASITHCDLIEIRCAVNNIYSQLVPGGLYFGLDWFSVYHSDYKSGKSYGVSPRDVVSDSEGQFAGLGKVHFTDEAELRELFSQFELIHLTHKVVYDQITNKVFASWSLVARKPFGN